MIVEIAIAAKVIADGVQFQAHVSHYPWIPCLVLSLSSLRSGINSYAQLVPSASKYVPAVSAAKFRPSLF
ncbi:hypothetical protein PMIN03_011028 [Paraphaeosphaeria minitans]